MSCNGIFEFLEKEFYNLGFPFFFVSFYGVGFRYSYLFVIFFNFHSVLFSLFLAEIYVVISVRPRVFFCGRAYFEFIYDVNSYSCTVWDLLCFQF